MQIIHAFEKHEHTFCTSKVEHHIHKWTLNCSLFHKQLTVFSVNFVSHFDVTTTHFYASIFVDKP
ncbi:MAG: hypothetical protein ACWIPI_09080, partial [Polaribacter sp.]